MIENDIEELHSVNEGLRLIQKKNGLKYGTDALLLAAFIGRHGEGATAIELGSGTGIISLLCLARNQIGSVTALEVQPEYAALTERNAKENGLETRLRAVCSDLRDYPGNEQADLIFTNPPYMKANCGKQNRFEEKYIARHEAKGTIEDFCTCGASMLKYGGKFYVVYRPDRMADLICAMRNARLEPKRILFVSQTADHAPCLVLIEGKKGAASGAVVPKSFILMNADGSETNEMKELLQRGTIYGN